MRLDEEDFTKNGECKLTFYQLYLKYFNKLKDSVATGDKELVIESLNTVSNIASCIDHTGLRQEAESEINTFLRKPEVKRLLN